MKLKNGQSVIPVPGHVFVRMESLFQNIGKIIIPQAYKSAKMCVGRIVDIAYSLNQQMRLGLEAIRVDIRVIMLSESGREIVAGEDVYDFTLEYHVLEMDDKKTKRYAIQAILSDDVKLGTQEQEIPRCHLCGNTKESGQGMIMWNGVCPRCHRDRYGILQPHGKELPPVKVDDGEVAAMSEKMVRPRRKSDGEYKPDGNVIHLKM